MGLKFEESSVVTRNNIVIDYTRDSLIPEQGRVMLTKPGFYKREGEDSPQEGFSRAATCYCFGDYGLAQRIYDAVSQKWFTFASPVLSNAVNIDWPTFGLDEFEEAGGWLEENVDPDGMPISCFLPFVPDTKEGLVQARSESNWLSMLGGGIGVYLSNRSPDEKSTGVMSHLRGYDADSLSYRQTTSRRGSIAAYLDVTHPEIMSFINMRDPSGGDANKKCFNLNNGVNLPDSFMQKVVTGEDYELVDPKHGPTGKYLNAREVWEKLIELRFRTGEPYLHFIDTTNRNIPSWITKPTYQVRQSNLCSEIVLMTSSKRTAVCCLSSLNLEKYDEWKDTTLVEDLVRFLDNVLEYFIRLAPPQLKRAVYSAYKERAIGMGTLGLHSWFQKNNIPFESGMGAASECHNLYSSIKEKAVESSKQLARERGEPSDCLGSGMRNSHLMAIAPNASSASLVGVSPSIEPNAANAYNAQGRAGSFLIKNQYLEQLIERLGKNTEEVWNSIIKNEGSVQHLDFLTDHDKKVFATFKEIDQRWVIELASIRQPHICQAQSLNIKVRKGITKQEMSDLHMLAWVKGLKTLYYCRAEEAHKTQLEMKALPDQPLNAVKTDDDFGTCLACEG